MAEGWGSRVAEGGGPTCASLGPEVGVAKGRRARQNRVALQTYGRGFGRWLLFYSVVRGEAAHSLCLQCRVLLSLELHLSRAVPSFSAGSLGQLSGSAHEPCGSVPHHLGSSHHPLSPVYVLSSSHK
jgi:hypothetical protein